MTDKFPLDQIDPNPWQTRQGEPDRSYIKELALDIAAKGLLQVPIGRLFQNGHPFDYAPFGGSIHDDELASVLRDEPDIRVQLAFGHNRLAAYKWLQDIGPNSNIPGDWSSMPVELRALSDEQIADFAWSENERRRDVDPVSRALAIQKRIADFVWTHDQAAAHLGLSRPTITNLLRLLSLPEEIQAHLASGQISPRQADALLSLYAIPAAILERGEREWDGSVKPSRIVADALAGESSDDTRERAKRLLERFSKKLNDAPWSLGQEFAGHPDRQSPSCKDCIARHDANNWKYCLNPACYRSREQAYQDLYLEEASASAGILVLEAGVNFYAVHDFTGYRGEAEDLKKILEIRPLCPNLRLAYTGRDDRPHVDGKPHAAVVCSKRRQFCTCQNGLNAARELARRAAQQPALAGNGAHEAGESPAAPASKSLLQVFEEHDLAELAKQARAEKRTRAQQAKALCASAAGVIARALGEDRSGAWELVLHAIAYNAASSHENAGAEELRTLVAEKIVERDVLSYGGDDDPEIALSRINNAFKKAGLSLLSPDGSLSTDPGDDPAARLAHRWERVKGWIGSLPKAAPTLAAIQGNIDNLAAIDEELAEMVEENPALAGDPNIAPILAGDDSPTANLERLSALQEVLERAGWADVGPDEFERVSWLCHTPAGDVNFKSQLESATAPVLAYALALVSGVPGHGTRAAAIRSRLNRLEREGAKA